MTDPKLMRPFTKENMNGLTMRPFVFESFDKAKIENKVSAKLQEEDLKAKSQQFEYLPEVLEHRKISEYRKQAYDNQLHQAVETEVNSLREQAVVRGLEEGKEIGAQKAKQEMLAKIDAEIKSFGHFFEEIKTIKSKIIEGQLDKIVEILSKVTKWVILRELKDDGAYLKRLIQKIIKEVDTKESILIKIPIKRKENFQQISLKMEEEFKRIENLKFEYLDEEQDEGVLIETGNEIIDARLEKQLEILNSIFQDIEFE